MTIEEEVYDVSQVDETISVYVFKEIENKVLTGVEC